jgi:hypothetical protein
MDIIEKNRREAFKNIDNLTGLKDFYTKSDAFNILKSFGYVEEFSFDELDYYLEQKNIYSSILDFTKGFVKEDDYKMYAVRHNKHFYIFVIGYFNSFIHSYYTNIIDDESMKICFIFEEMKK